MMLLLMDQVLQQKLFYILKIQDLDQQVEKLLYIEIEKIK